MTLSKQIMQGMYGKDMTDFINGMNGLNDGTSKNDILGMLNKELSVCENYNILSLKTGLQMAVNLISALPIEYKSVVVKPMIIRMLEEHLELNKSYQLHSSFLGMEHAIGMIRVYGIAR